MSKINLITKNRLLIAAATLYNGKLDMDFAEMLVKRELDDFEVIDNVEHDMDLDFISSTGYTPEDFAFVKDLQESGAVNMFLARPFIINCLHKSEDDARDLLMLYMKHYGKIYKGN